MANFYEELEKARKKRQQREDKMSPEELQKQEEEAQAEAAIEFMKRRQQEWLFTLDDPREMTVHPEMPEPYKLEQKASERNIMPEPAQWRSWQELHTNWLPWDLQLGRIKMLKRTKKLAADAEALRMRVAAGELDDRTIDKYRSALEQRRQAVKENWAELEAAISEWKQFNKLTQQEEELPEHMR